MLQRGPLLVSGLLFLTAVAPGGEFAQTPAGEPDSAGFEPVKPADPARAAAQERAATHLNALVARGDALLDQLAQKDADESNIKRKLQDLIFEYEDFLRANPDFAFGYAAYGRLLGRAGMHKQSAGMLLKANRLDPHIPFVKNQLGNYLAEDGKPIEAVNYFLAAIRLAPKEPLYHYQLGTLLYEARDDFLKSGEWTRPQIDQAMSDAFRRASELAPDNFTFAYRYAESFYDLEKPSWDEALKIWGALEDRCDPGLEKETIRLHAANIFIKQGQPDHARLLLNTVNDEKLAAQKQKLLDHLAAATEK